MGDWDEKVEGAATGVVTHFAQCLNKIKRPDELDEENFDLEGLHWPDGLEWRGNYKMELIKNELT